MRVTGPATLDAIVGDTLLRQKLLAGVAGAFAFFGLLLAAIDLFGLLSYSVGRRTKDMGSRVAVGARRNKIVALVLKDIGALMCGGLIAGLAGALAITTAAGMPGRRAATIDPVRALREE